jgi:hypothetical protein
MKELRINIHATALVPDDWVLENDADGVPYFLSVDGKEVHLEIKFTSPDEELDKHLYTVGNSLVYQDSSLEFL